MTEHNITNICLKDRNYVYGNTTNFIKKTNIDVFFKMIILLVNSIGFKNNINNDIILLVDEVKNKNMSDNLFRTFERIKMPKKYINFYNPKCKEHVKLGFLLPICMLFKMLLLFMILFPLSLFNKDFFAQKISSACVNNFLIYLKRFSSKVYKYILMSDHHFYSTICCVSYEAKSYVLQHGLIKEKVMYYPIRAGHFCSWGKHSKQMLNNDKKIIITGTYKFDIIKNNINISKIEKMLFCISTLDTKIVEEKISILNEISKNKNLKLYVKCHPGSLFDLNYWKQTFSDCDITFYKEENLSDIDFDFAISENSTITLDLIMMGKPFIIFDSSNGYFGKYFNILPHGNNMSEINDCVENINKIDYNKIYDVLIDNELNNNICNLREMIEGKDI